MYFTVLQAPHFLDKVQNVSISKRTNIDIRSLAAAKHCRAM